MEECQLLYLIPLNTFVSSMEQRRCHHFCCCCEERPNKSACEVIRRRRRRGGGMQVTTAVSNDTLRLAENQVNTPWACEQQICRWSRINMASVQRCTARAR